MYFRQIILAQMTCGSIGPNLQFLPSALLLLPSPLTIESASMSLFQRKFTDCNI